MAGTGRRLTLGSLSVHALGGLGLLRLIFGFLISMRVASPEQVCPASPAPNTLCDAGHTPVALRSQGCGSAARWRPGRTKTATGTRRVCIHLFGAYPKAMLQLFSELGIEDRLQVEGTTR